VSDERSRAELERALRAAEETLRLRDEFLRLVGHELRSPLTAMQLQVDSLAMTVRQGGPSQTVEERADRVRHSVQRLAWLVEEVVDVGRAVGGRLALHVGFEDLVLVARRALDRVAVELRRSGCQVSVDAPGPIKGGWDAARLEHSIGVLLLAATKSGAGQPIHLELASDGDAGEVPAGTKNGLGVRVSVRYGGTGLSDHERALVFDSFDGLLAALPPASPALGLWLVRAVAEAHGGRLAIAAGLSELHLPKTGRAAPGLIGDASDP
jgi:signal transduction histidine kinase